MKMKQVIQEVEKNIPLIKEYKATCFFMSNGKSFFQNFGACYNNSYDNCFYSDFLDIEFDVLSKEYFFLDNFNYIVKTKTGSYTGSIVDIIKLLKHYKINIDVNKNENDFKSTLKTYFEKENKTLIFEKYATVPTIKGLKKLYEYVDLFERIDEIMNNNIEILLTHFYMYKLRGAIITLEVNNPEKFKNKFFAKKDYANTSNFYIYLNKRINKYQDPKTGFIGEAEAIRFIEFCKKWTPEFKYYKQNIISSFLKDLNKFLKNSNEIVTPEVKIEAPIKQKITKVKKVSNKKETKTLTKKDNLQTIKEIKYSPAPVPSVEISKIEVNENFDINDYSDLLKIVNKTKSCSFCDALTNYKLQIEDNYSIYICKDCIIEIENQENEELVNELEISN